MTVALPALHTIINESSLSSPCPSPSSDNGSIFMPIKDKTLLHLSPRLPFPLLPESVLPASHGPARDDHGRRVSTCSMSSAPSLTFSPSPSPPPSRPQAVSPDSFRLVPCTLQRANAVIVLPDQSSIARDDRSTSLSSPPSKTSTPTFRACKPSEARAILLIGPAISAHARKCAASAARRMHPYRIVRDHSGSQRMELERRSSVPPQASKIGVEKCVY